MRSPARLRPQPAPTAPHAGGPRRRPALALAAVGLLGMSGLTACSGAGTDEAAATPTPSASTSATTSPTDSESATPTPPPSPEPEAPTEPTGLKNTKKGRAAFTTYVIDAWVYAFVSNDTDPLTSVAVKGGCQGCSGLVKEMTKRDKQGWHVELYGVGVGKVKEPKKQPQGRTTITTTQIAIPESQILNDDGSLRATSPAHPDATFTAKVTWDPPAKGTGKGKKKQKKTPGEFQLESFGVVTEGS